MLPVIEQGLKRKKAKEFAVAINSCDQLKLLKTVADDAEEFDQKYCQALTTLMNLGLPAEESARVISNHLNGFPGGGGVDDLVKEMADTLPIIPHTGPVTEGYVGVVRDCSQHITALKKAGDSIERMEDAKRAINDFAAVLIQQPENANLDEALKCVNQWIKEQKDSGQQFQPNGSVLFRLTGFAQCYDSELLRATKVVSRLCKDFDVCLEKFHQTDDDSKIGLKEWINDNQLSPQLAEAFIKRARLSEGSAVVGAPAPPPPPPLAVVGAPPPPPPPPPVGMATGSNTKPEVAGQKPKPAPRPAPESAATTSSTSPRKWTELDFSNVKLKKAGRGTTGELKETQKDADPRGDLMAAIRKGKKLRKTDNSKASPEQSTQPKSKDQKDKIRQAEKKMLDNQLDRLEAEVKRLKDRISTGSDDPGVVRAYELELTNAQQEVEDFLQQNPDFKKGPLTAEQLAIPEKSEDVDLLTGLLRRVRAIQGDEEDSGNEDDPEWSD